MNKTEKLRVPRDLWGKGLGTDRKLMCAVSKLSLEQEVEIKAYCPVPPSCCNDPGQVLFHSERHLSNEGLGQTNTKLAPGEECCTPHEPEFMTVQILKIPNCPSHWLYLNCAFLINSGGVISVFPA